MKRENTYVFENTKLSLSYVTETYNINKRKNFIQLILVIDGCGEIIFSEGTIVFVKKNDFVFVGHDFDNVTLNLHSKGKKDALLIEIELESLHNFVSEDSFINNFQIDIKNNSNYINRGLLKEVYVEYISKALSIEITKSLEYAYYLAKSVEIVCLCLSQNKKEKNKKNNLMCPFIEDSNIISKIKEAKSILVSNLSKQISIEELSKKTGLKKHILTSKFKKNYGISISEMYYNYKMEKAKNLLLSNKININSISKKLGYSSMSHFSTSFKKKFGISPRKYKNLK